MINHRSIRLTVATCALAAAIVVPAGCAAAPSAPPTPALTAPAANPQLDRAAVVRWVETYLQAWKDKDDVAVGELFTDDAVYQVVPGDDAQTHTGREAIREYWRTITTGQSDVTTHHGEPLIQGDRAAVELWITLRAGGKWMTFVETNVLHFAPNGQVRRNAEYWIMRDGSFAPPAGWGSSS